MYIPLKKKSQHRGNQALQIKTDDRFQAKMEVKSLQNGFTNIVLK